MQLTRYKVKTIRVYPYGIKAATKPRVNWLSEFADYIAFVGLVGAVFYFCFWIN